MERLWPRCLPRAPGTAPRSSRPLPGRRRNSSRPERQCPWWAPRATAWASYPALYSSLGSPSLGPAVLLPLLAPLRRPRARAGAPAPRPCVGLQRAGEAVRDHYCRAGRHQPARPRPPAQVQSLQRQVCGRTSLASISASSSGSATGSATSSRLT